MLRGVTDVVLDPSTVVTAHTVVLPTAPPDGVAVSVTSTRNIATLTFTSLDATAVINGATTALQGNQGSVDLLYVASTNSWQPKATANLVTATLNGLAPASGGGTTNFLRADGTWAAPPSPPTPTTVTSTQAGLAPASGGGTTNFLRADSTWAAPPYPSAVTSTDAGLAPASGGGTTNFLRADGTWAAPTTTYTPTSHFLQATYTQTTPISVPATNLASWTQVKASNASVKGDANELLDVAATGSYLVSITGRMRVGAVTGPAVYYVQFSVYSLSGNLLSTFYAGPQSGAFTAAASYVIAHTFIADIGHNDPMLINAVLSTSGATVTPAWTTAGTGTETRMGSPLTVTFTKI